MASVYPNKYDVIVVGAGHAGIEAALASSRMGSKTLLLTMNCDTIGQMSCNPAIGGLGKGQLVREVDALGGEMGKAADMTGIQFRMLNTKKGPSVWAPRAQCDKKAYQFRMKWICEREPNIDIRQAQTTYVITNNGSAEGVGTTYGVEFHSKCVVLTTGTFLRGLMHTGTHQQPGGRSGESAAMSLSESLLKVGIEMRRLKTGTPPRLLKRSIDFSKTEVQAGDEPPPFFTFWRDDLFEEAATYQNPKNAAGLNDNQALPKQLFHVEQTGQAWPSQSVLAKIGGQLPCHISYTTAQTAELITANLHKSAMYSGAINSVGPRYCPSIEDKIVRFSSKERHQIFLEPEGAYTDEIYVNGLSTSLPYEIQVGLIKTIIGCEEAEILRPAYAVEYDFAPPTQLNPSLESKTCHNLFFAGQINGTSGYEEAAGQGIIAGINAARRCQAKEPCVLRRDQAYIGVLIDDLVTKGTLEPYRMFTSRAEHRLLLRQDNADFRLSGLGYELGLLPERSFSRMLAKKNAVESEISRLHQIRYGATTLASILKRPASTYRNIPQSNGNLTDDVALQVEIAIKYEGYIQREQTEVRRFGLLENRPIPAWVDYRQITNIRTEARQKLQALRPQTVGQASRVSGVTPADISVLLVWLKSGEPA